MMMSDAPSASALMHCKPYIMADSSLRGSDIEDDSFRSRDAMAGKWGSISKCVIELDFFPRDLMISEISWIEQSFKHSFMKESTFALEISRSPTSLLTWGLTSRLYALEILSDARLRGTTELLGFHSRFTTVFSDSLLASVVEVLGFHSRFTTALLGSLLTSVEPQRRKTRRFTGHVRFFSVQISRVRNWFKLVSQVTKVTNLDEISL